jgi:hypothetical protein
MTKDMEMLLNNISACGKRIDKLAYSVGKNKAFFPLTPESLESLGDAQEESLDALILRYSQAVTMILWWI